ncbi:MAG: RNA-protein complex protein Nop10 [Nitrososphaerota archaeon]|nr:RNA-protein complex protein Nop10 [Nitrososphaerota archaeon]MDG6942961.1 RNA-protein complex protein Nop10 [Nitrososphaerota archaeon]MDG6950689.1 RNA-protein complex protein Nop10 [Nitrososphaerota archaeon]
MRSLMLKCDKCNRYTMCEKCPKCGAQTVTVHPARYSPDDRYARYRSPSAYEEQQPPVR